jgi:asparagine synthase (glutamine-hydrolysing)
MLYVNSRTSLPDDLLVEADKTTIATLVEPRVPCLHHKVLELAAQLPPALKVKGRATKPMLNRAFQGRVPAEILSRKKTGFPVPFGRGLNNYMHGFVSDTLLSSRAATGRYFRRDGSEQILKSAKSDSVLASETFSLVILELWHHQFADQTAPVSGPDVSKVENAAFAEG